MSNSRMNSINKNGKAFNGNRSAVYVAIGFLVLFVISVIIRLITD